MNFLLKLKMHLNWIQIIVPQNIKNVSPTEAEKASELDLDYRPPEKKK